MADRLFALAGLCFFGFAAAMATRLAFREFPEPDPRSSAAWIDRGLAAEQAGRFGQAEQELLEAARLDRQYLPAWTLANYYFRRGRPASFWPWAARAAALNYDDLGPLLQLSDRIEPDPGASLDRLGPTPRIERAYLDFLIGEDRLDAAQTVARRMLSRHTPDETPRLIDLVNRQIRAGRAVDALEIWNALARFPRLDPAAGAILTNGDLGAAPGGDGFDWRLPVVEGLASAWRSSRIDFILSGNQPEACTLLEQALPAAPKRYRLVFEYATPGMPRPSGIHWTFEGNESPALEASDTWRAGEWMVVLKHVGVAYLRLVYRREPGTVRAGGRVGIRNLRLNAL